jgi:hypothetical protein
MAAGQTREGSMRDVDALVETIQRIELILAEHIEPGHKSDPQETIDRIFSRWMLLKPQRRGAPGIGARFANCKVKGSALCGGACGRSLSALRRQERSAHINTD